MPKQFVDIASTNEEQRVGDDRPRNYSSASMRDIEGKKVIYFVSTDTGNYGSFDVIVPGVAVSDFYRTPNNQDAIYVEPITDVEFRSRVTEALSKGRHVSFW